MTPKQFEAAIARLALSQRAAGRFLEQDERTIRKWVAGDRKVHPCAAKLLRTCIEYKIKPENIK